MEESQTAKKVDVAELIREDGDYMKRQPRIDHSRLSYNFEQFSQYMWYFKQAKERDDQEQRKFYKLVKYVKAN